ncbi:probable peroxisomal membrane protein PEX13 [Amphibalanus amphitrite]|uniref:probable peroxisomal membrane protein PEX13 n=1 Tax=Amphibalanus amphitrite TaxID=1232801 RepID=UPI001C907B17|nr:probable peroxisomal membrane protein PEX13 [Amphibalanus amphitrite]
MKSITAVLAFGAIAFTTINSASGTLSKGEEDDDRRYIRVTSINGIDGYDSGDYDNVGYVHGGYNDVGYGPLGYGSGDYGKGGFNDLGYAPGSYGGEKHGAKGSSLSYPGGYAQDSYGAASQGHVTHYTDVIIKKEGDEGHKGFFKGLKAAGKDFQEGVSNFVSKGRELVGLDHKYEFVGVLRPKNRAGYGRGGHSSGIDGALFDQDFVRVY